MARFISPNAYGLISDTSIRSDTRSWELNLTTRWFFISSSLDLTDSSSFEKTKFYVTEIKKHSEVSGFTFSSQISV